MPFQVVLSETAKEAWDEQERTNARRHAKIVKTLRILSDNPRHPSLNSHKRRNEAGPNGEDLWESYVENQTPSAWRIYWIYGPLHDTITVVAIVPHD